MTNSRFPHSLTVDFIRILAIIGVIAIHTDVITSSFTNYLGGLSWWFVNCIHTASRVAVPLFFMASGYLYLNPQKQITPGYILNKIIYRLGLPLVIWTLVYIWWDIYWLKNGPQLFTYLKIILTGSVFHLYFLVILIGFYAVTPWIKPHLIKLPTSKLLLYLTLGFILAALATAVSYVLGHRTLPSLFFSLWLPYLSYYLAGYAIGYRYHPKRHHLYLFLVAYLFLTGITAYLNYQNTRWYLSGFRDFWTSMGGQYFTEHFSPSIIIMSLCLFAVLINLDVLSSRLYKSLPKKTIILLASASFGIYLIHPIVLQLIDHYGRLSIQFVTGSLWWYYLKKIFLTYTISLIIVLIARQLPIVKKAFGE